MLACFFGYTQEEESCILGIRMVMMMMMMISPYHLISRGDIRNFWGPRESLWNVRAEADHNGGEGVLGGQSGLHICRSKWRFLGKPKACLRQKGANADEQIFSSFPEYQALH